MPIVQQHPSTPTATCWEGRDSGPTICPSGEAGLSLLHLNPLPVLQVTHHQAQ